MFLREGLKRRQPGIRCGCVLVGSCRTSWGRAVGRCERRQLLPLGSVVPPGLRVQQPPRDHMVAGVAPAVPDLRTVRSEAAAAGSVTFVADEGDYQDHDEDRRQHP